jgi:SAM-dependent methyltransferase
MLARVLQARSLVADVPPIPFANDAFDFVLSFETVEHIADDVESIREIRRVLRLGPDARDFDTEG